MPYSLRSVIIIAAVLVLTAHALAQPCFEWLPGNGRSVPTISPSSYTPLGVTASVVHDDGAGETLYIGTYIDGTGQSRVYRMINNTFEQMGGSFTGGAIECLQFHDGVLYVGGLFQQKLVKWDGDAWATLPPLPGQQNVVRVSALCTYENNLIAGYQQQPSGDCVAMLDGDQWVSLAFATGTYSYVGALQVYNGDIIAAGEFFSLQDDPSINYIARYDGATWHPMLTTMNLESGYSFIETMVVHEGELIVGGFFLGIDGVPSRAVIRWNGSQWLSTGGISVSHYRCFALLSWNGVLYQTGAHWPFSPEGCTGNFSRWTNGVWEDPAGCLAEYDYLSNVFRDGAGSSLAALGDRVIVGGGFEFLGSASLEAPLYRYDNLAAWDGTHWESVTGSVDHFVDDLEIYRGQMHACGTTNGYNTPIFAFNGDHWKRLPSSDTDVRPAYVYALEAHEDFLYVGGDSSNTPELPVFARWDGAMWSVPAEQPNNYINTLVGIGPDLFVGGPFTMIGSNPVGHIARWDGDNWHTLGNGLASDAGFSTGVYIIAPFQGSVFAGGSFSNSAGTPMRAIAQWNGVEWSAVGGGLTAASGNPSVSAMAEYQDALYIGGRFNSAGKVQATNLARWDGIAWHAVPGPVLNSSVSALHVAFDSLFVGGFFNITHNKQNLSRIARFDGSDWFALDTGLSSYPASTGIYRIKHLGPTLFAGGFIRSPLPLNQGQYVLRWGYDPIPGDADTDGAVTMADITTTLSNFNTIAPPGGYAPGDADQNNEVNFADITAILLHYGAVCP